MAHTKQVLPPRRRLSPEQARQIRAQMSMMSVSRPSAFASAKRSARKPKRKPARSRRKIRDIDLTNELHDLERDIALHSTPEASNPPSCSSKDSLTLAHGEQPGRRDVTSSESEKIAGAAYRP